VNSPPLVLVVEDNEVNQLLTASVLEREGFAVDRLARLRAQRPLLVLADRAPARAGRARKERECSCQDAPAVQGHGDTYT